MKLVTTSNLKDGMVLASNVYSLDDQLVLKKGTVLDDNAIKRIKSFSVYNVFIEEEKKPAQKTFESEPSQYDLNLTHSERVKRSPEFALFKADIEKNASALRNKMQYIVNSDVPVNVDSLIDPVLNLFEEAGGTVGIFDMLNNLHVYSDAVYMHSLNVALIGNTIARWMKLKENEIELVTAAGLLHDIGKTLMPEELLNKTQPLTEYEEKIMRTHVTKGYDILKDQNIDDHIKNAVIMHHERVDGSGYPFKLSGNKIDDIAKIIMVADVYDEMTSLRTYKKPMCAFKVIEAFEYEGFRKYDPDVLMTFLSHIVNTFIANRVRLSNGLEGDIVFINPDHLSKPLIKVKEKYIDLYQIKDVTIEEVI
ncbi:MAG: HD domain-containing protein [Butyrivibrio sp.]|jgi:putative nucleotidyltransferase with HDIG domain|nr:HD domain-containing protein [Butyrivibrio sp.]